MKKLFTLLFLLSVILVSGCAVTEHKHSKMEIVTSTTVYKDIAKNIVKNHGTVKAIINSSNVDPHDFNPDTNTAKLSADADIIIANGLGYDDWLLKLGNSNEIINVSQNVAHLSDGQNEHVWFDINYMKKLSIKITSVAEKKDKKNIKYYENNRDDYLKKLDILQKKENILKNRLSNKKAYVSEPVFSYMLNNLGVKIKNPRFAKAIEDGTDPSISDMEKIENGLNHKDVDFVVINKQVNSNVVNNVKEIAKKNNIPIIYVTESMPANTSYIDWINMYLKELSKIS